jgi:tight adherence protein B
MKNSEDEDPSKWQRTNLAMIAAAEQETIDAKNSYRISLEDKLRYANWPISLTQFRALQALVTILVFLALFSYISFPLKFAIIVMVPLMVRSVLDRAVRKRFDAFDRDYPVMLMSYVSLLKTGMSAIGGLEAAAKGLPEDSAVRYEIELMLERMRLGLTESQAIGAFAEDIPHPEVDLFVQGLILSRKVGGTLSSTIERLAKQVRKNQQFRRQAMASVAMQQASVYLICGVMTGLFCYMAYASFELVAPAFSHPAGKAVFQGGLTMIIFGFYWSRVVTNIKI